MRINAQLLAVRCKGLRHRGGRRDGIPGSDCGTSINRTQRSRIIPVNEDLVAHAIRTTDTETTGVLQVSEYMVAPEPQSLEVRLDEAILAGILLADQRLQHTVLDVEKRRERTDINHVLEQLPVTRQLIPAIGNLGQRHADYVDVITKL